MVQHGAYPINERTTSGHRIVFTVSDLYCMDYDDLG
jgi:hypothetical protein